MEGVYPMRVAIVDDSPADENRLRDGLSRWAAERAVILDPPPAIFFSAEALLASFKPDVYDVVFLDICLQGMTGMDAARRIRRQDSACRLIFTSVSPDFAVESYEVDSTYYLLKPYSYEQLSAALNRCNPALLERAKAISVPTRTGQARLMLHQIVYTEYINRKITVHLRDGAEMQIAMKQGDFAALMLEHPYFCDCIKGILVNFEAVEKLTEDSFLLLGGVRVPISRLKYRDVRERFLCWAYQRARGLEKG